MSSYTIEITEPAEQDLHEIGRYIAIELVEPAVAKRVIEKLAEAILKLEELPLRNALVADEALALQGMRKMLVDNYIIFYVVSEEQRKVTVVRILYSRRDWINLIGL